jgi:hypothetical protein
MYSKDVTGGTNWYFVNPLKLDFGRSRLAFRQQAKVNATDGNALWI